MAQGSPSSTEESGSQRSAKAGGEDEVLKGRFPGQAGRMDEMGECGTMQDRLARPMDNGTEQDLFLHQKFQQKALKQTKQKKSKSAEFLMGEEERAAAEGIENPAFNISKTDLSAYQASEGKEIKHDRQDSSLAAHQQKNGLQAHAEPRGNEHRQNYFDPPMDEEIDPRQYGMEVSTEDDLELRSVREDEREFYKKLSKFFEEEETTVIDLPGMITEEGRAGPGVQKCSGVFPGIASLRQEVEDEVIPHYVEQFEECVQGDMIAVGSLSLEQQAFYIMCNVLILNRWCSTSRKVVLETSKCRWLLTQTLLYCSAESQLLKTLKKRKGGVIAKYGELTKTKPRPDRIRGMKWKVEWSKTPQPVEIQLRCLRGVKDKLPQGSVTLKVSLYNRLGGYALHWSKAKEQLWAGTTQPVQHNGNFYNLELHVNQSVYTILPAKSDVQPGMVFIFELFLLPGTNIHMNQVVGWGAFPVCDSQFETLEGKFKCPLLRGPQDPRIDQFRKIEELISYDLDNWLCTIYFQVIKLPQSEQKEYEVTLQIPPHVHQSSDCFYACEKTEEGQKGCNTQESTLRRSQLGLSARCRCSSSYLQAEMDTNESGSEEDWFCEDESSSSSDSEENVSEALKRLLSNTLVSKFCQIKLKIKSDFTHQSVCGVRGQCFSFPQTFQIQAGKVCDKSKPENAKKTSDRISANEENGMYYKKESNPHLKADSSSEDSVKDFQYCSFADKLEEYRFSLRYTPSTIDTISCPCHAYAGKPYTAGGVRCKDGVIHNRQMVITDASNLGWDHNISFPSENHKQRLAP
ncbi:UNVERIFIED_CONTAM: hypothetical protein FKN15_056731 [Acipenser sinensis]